MESTNRSAGDVPTSHVNGIRQLSRAADLLSARGCIRQTPGIEFNPCLDTDVRKSGVDTVKDPNSILAEHRVHQLSAIGEDSNSSKQSVLLDLQRHAHPVAGDGVADVRPPPKLTSPGYADSASDAASTEFVTPIGPPALTQNPRWPSQATSVVSLPLHEIPVRRSSVSILGQNAQGRRRTSLQDLPSWRHPPKTVEIETVPKNGSAVSPLRHTLARGIQSSEGTRQFPARTFVRTIPPMDLFAHGATSHPRFEMSIRLPSPLFVGGGTVDGQLELRCDQDQKKKNKTKPLFISKLSVDVVGVEQVNEGKRNIFLSLATELFDADHPPPPALVQGHIAMVDSELLWETRPASVIVPFSVNLPLKLGPPPYLSKSASIRYLVSPSAVIKIGNKHSTIRQIWNCQMFTVHDPEKALASLPSPLIASDSLAVGPSQVQHVKISAGLHRQTWVNGSSLFLDIHVTNNTAKTLKKIELRLEKTSLFYPHAAASTAEKSASHLRLATRSETEVASSAVIKKSHEWKGVLAHASEIRTCELQIPRGHVTVTSGRYFEVRYFVRVLVYVTMFKALVVQLPITVIHIHSLDILPNSLAQVAASIEAKRSRVVPFLQHGHARGPHRQGQVYEAARRLSLEHAEAGDVNRESLDLASLMYDVDHSPRRAKLSHISSNNRRPTCESTRTNENAAPGRPSIASHHHHRRHPSCYHCHLVHGEAHQSSSATYTGPKLPRLQVSTSGLGFSESEFEVPPDSPPRKVMLSEQERRMIMQQRELNLKRDRSIKHAHKLSQDITNIRSRNRAGIEGYQNVAVAPGFEAKLKDIGTMRRMPPAREVLRQSQPGSRSTAPPLTQTRNRSKTNPEALRSAPRQALTAQRNGPLLGHAKQEIKSMDRGRRVPRTATIEGDGAVFG